MDFVCVTKTIHLNVILSNT